MSDRIVYEIILNPGGVDGLSQSPGGKVTAAAWDRRALEKHPSLPWGKIVPRVVDFERERKAALDKLTFTERLILQGR